MQALDEQELAGLGGFDRHLWLFLGLATVLLIAGWTLPLMTVEHFFIFDDQITILGALARIQQNGDSLLFLLVGLFTVVFPVLKLALALAIWWRLGQGDRRLSRFAALMDSVGKWSMLDVFVVALLVVIIKVSLVADVTLHVGLYVFAAAVILSMVTVARITALAKRKPFRPRRPETPRDAGS